MMIKSNQSVTGRGRWGWLLATAVLPILVAMLIWRQDLALAAPGDPVPGVACNPSYSATIYAEGLTAPDGLAFNPSGVLYVAEETAGRVTEVSSSGALTPVMTGLSNPEGIAFDTAGNLYVVEDVQNGRLLRRTPSGTVTTLASNLDAPEGVVVAADGTVYITESNAQFEANSFLWQSHVTAVVPGGSVTRLTTSAPVITGFDVAFFSASGITLGADGLLYVANEASGVEVVQAPFTLTTTKSISTVVPATGVSAILSNGLTAPEGLRFANTGQFPLYAAEENGGNGRISRVNADGSFITLCTGFGTIEDVVVDGNRWLYISDDTNGTIVRIDDGQPTAVTLQSFKPQLFWPAWTAVALAVLLAWGTAVQLRRRATRLPGPSAGWVWRTSAPSLAGRSGSRWSCRRWPNRGRRWTIPVRQYPALFRRRIAPGSPRAQHQTPHRT